MNTNKPVPPTDFPHTERTRVTRKPDRGSYDRELIYSILDQAFVCSIAFIADGIADRRADELRARRRQTLSSRLDGQPPDENVGERRTVHD